MTSGNFQLLLKMALSVVGFHGVKVVHPALIASNCIFNGLEQAIPCVAVFL